MPLVCPQCKQLFEESGVCPQCSVVLLYHAASLQNEGTPPPSVQDERSEWQQTPWGKIAIGLILAQGLNFGLQQLLTAGFLAGDSGDIWETTWGIVLHHAVLALSLLVGGALSGAGQSRGILYGSMVGLASGIITLIWHGRQSEQFSSILVYAEPIIHLATGGIGAAIGMLIWKPTPTIPDLEGSSPTPIVFPSFSVSFGNLFHGPVHFSRVCIGAFVVVIGVVWSHAIFEFLIRASNGNLMATKLQAQLVSMEISALVALLGAGFAGATTRNGFKHGLCVGLAAGAVVLGVQVGDPKFVIESTVLTIAGTIIVSLIGGWFGGQLFPPIDPSKRKRRLSYQ